VERQVDLLDWYKTMNGQSLTRFKNLLLTGSPGCGKTTVLERVVEHLGDCRLAGFLTLELREHGQRVGFEAVGLGGHRVILAHVRFRSLVLVGRYGVEPDRWDRARIQSQF
jgi:nucleoside-triphosphatase